MTTSSVEPTHRGSAPGWGLRVALGLVVLAMGLPAALGWYVHVHSFPPLHADWRPRVGWGTVPALLLGVLVARHAVDFAERLAWRRLMLCVFFVGITWMLALAFVVGARGVGEILDTPYEYLRTARTTTDLPATLREYVDRITQSATPNNWPVHVAGHPPGALAFFVLLVRLGLGSGFLAGLVVTVLAASTAVAVMLTVRRLGSEQLARRAAPFLVLGPAAIWQCVSADAMFAAVAAWGMACLAVAATSDRTGASIAWSIAAGLLLGYCVMLSYGLPLLGVLALAVLWLARSWLPMLPAALAASTVVAVFWVLGFNYLDALPAIHTRYWEAVGGRRQWEYWVWGDLAALVFSAGPLAFAGVAQAASRAHAGLRHPPERVVVRLSGAAVVMVLLADASLMSKAEVERIWLPFVPWLLLSCALLPERWRRRGLVLQAVWALVLQHLLFTGW